MESLHDHHLRFFSVDARTQTLRLETAWPSAHGPALAEGVFDGVQAYVILGDTLGTILLAIEEVDPFALYDEFGESMRRTYTDSRGHAPWARTVEDAREFLRTNSVHG